MTDEFIALIGADSAAPAIGGWVTLIGVFIAFLGSVATLYKIRVERQTMTASAAETATENALKGVEAHNRILAEENRDLRIRNDALQVQADTLRKDLNKALSELGQLKLRLHHIENRRERNG